MQVIGFNISKVLAEKSPSFKPASVINTDIEFINIEKEKIEVLKNIEPIKVFFKYTVSYFDSKEEKKKEGEVIFEGNVILSAEDQEAKDIEKAWKKKELPDSTKIPLFNFILKKCSPKALHLEDEIDLPSHIPYPRLRPQTKE